MATLDSSFSLHPCWGPQLGWISSDIINENLGFIDNKSSYRVVNVAKGVLRRGVDVSINWGLPTYLACNYPKISYLSLPKRALMGMYYNGSNAVYHAVYATKLVFDNKHSEANKHLKSALKFLYRGGLDYALVNLVPASLIAQIMIGEAALQAFVPSQIRSVVNSVFNFIDNQIIDNQIIEGLNPISDVDTQTKLIKTKNSSAQTDQSITIPTANIDGISIHSGNFSKRVNSQDEVDKTLSEITEKLSKLSIRTSGFRTDLNENRGNG